jgi:L-2-hydroxyglutarate oxidase LhgO
MRFDAVVVGGGIIGVATARQFLRTHKGTICLIEKESSLAAHQRCDDFLLRVLI